MKIIVAGGRNKADFLIGSLLENHHEVIVINDEENYCNYLSEKYNIAVIIGNPCKKYVLQEADINDSDVLIALRPFDSDNLVICQYAKFLFHVKKVVAIVSDPKNVDVFKCLGVNTAISATYTITKIIEQASTIENLVHSLSIEHDSIVMSEIVLTAECHVVNKKIKDLVELPKDVIICAVLRHNDLIVPNGNTLLQEQDKLLILSRPALQKQLAHYLRIGSFLL